MLAEAFCTSDERVRRIQAELDDAQATRTRTLAAFAVTVGNDGSIADVMGLNEREVRVARRTVGKEDARTLAAELLRRSAEPPLPQPEEPPTTVSETVQMPGPRAEATLPEPSPQPSATGACATGAATMGGTGAFTAGPSATPDAYPTNSAPAGSTSAGSAASAPVAASAGSTPSGRSTPADTAATAVSAQEEPVAWSPAMDSVLVWSWQSGIDLHAVAGELDLDVRAVLQRVQTLAAEGLLVLKPSYADSGQAGRHRRHDDFFVSAPDSPEELYTHAGYVTQPY